MTEIERMIQNVGRLLQQLDIEGTCQVCENSWRAHTDGCPVLGVLDSLDALAHGRA